MDINLTLIGQMITFSVFIIFTMKFVWPPLQKSMCARQAKIAEGLALTDRAEKELIAAKKNARNIIQKANSQAGKIMEKANLHALKICGEAKKNAYHHADRIRQAANNEATEQIYIMKQQLRKEVGIIALAGAEKLIQKNIDVATNNQLLEEIAAEL